MGDRSANRAGHRWTDVAGLSRAAMLGQVTQQVIHAAEIGAVDQVAALWLGADQIGMGQFLEVERQRAGRDPKLLGHGTRREAGRTGHDQRSKGPQALYLGQRGERAQCVDFLLC